MPETVDTDYIKLELLDNGILIASYKPQKKLNLAMMRDIVQTRLNFTGREPRPVLILDLGVVQIDKQARHYASSGDGLVGISAAATIADSLSTYIIMCIVYQFEKPPFPVKTFFYKKRAMT